MTILFYNLAHCSYEAGALEDPSIPPPDDMWTRTVDPRVAPDQPVDIQIFFEKGLPVKLRVGGKEYTDSLELFVALNEIGKNAGIGRIDIVEVRYEFIPSSGLLEISPPYLRSGLGLFWRDGGLLSHC